MKVLTEDKKQTLIFTSALHMTISSTVPLPTESLSPHKMSFFLHVCFHPHDAVAHMIEQIFR